ncbi:HD domain-containing protein [Azonexus fungiphilus]|nr:HD domain-containing protein [Azonexus fungiphilus]
MLTEKFAAAVNMAATAHAKQVRKGSNTPYIAHPLGVASLVLEFGGDEEQAIAGLLHDVIEDGGPQFIEPIREQFGERVLSMVEACTDGIPDAKGVKAPWRERKEKYLDHLGATATDALLVSAADKLYNARAILDDLLDPSVGRAVFERFSASKEETLWYYRELGRIFSDRQSPVAHRLNATVIEIQRLAA